MSIVGHMSYQIQHKQCSLKCRLKEAFQHTPIQIALCQAEWNLLNAQEILHKDPNNDNLVAQELACAH